MKDYEPRYVELYKCYQTIVDDFNREVLAIEIDLNIPSRRVISELKRIIASHAYPLNINTY